MIHDVWGGKITPPERMFVEWRWVETGSGDSFVLEMEWSDMEISDNDTEYVRKDKYDAVMARLNELEGGQLSLLAPRVVEQHTETIVCPECGKEQKAKVKLRESMPFWEYVHFCEDCGYGIMESEWDVVVV